MSRIAYRLPAEETTATAIGPRLFRKTILRTGRIEKGAHKIDVTPEYLTGLASNFTAGVMDNVPLVIGHPKADDVEKTRGRLRGVEVIGDQLVGTFELADAGAELLTTHPQIGCSVAIDPEFSRADGRKAGPTLVHVGIHNDPEVSGLGDWAALGGDYEVIDLGAEDDSATNPAQTTAESGGGNEKKEAPVALTDEQKKAATDSLVKLLKDAGVLPGDQEKKTEGAPPAADDKKPEDTKPEVSDDQIKAALENWLSEGVTSEQLDAIATPAVEVAPDLVAAGESDEAAQLRLARDENTKLAERVSKVEAERNDERWKAEELALGRDFAIPAKVVALAKPLLYGTDHVLTLGNQRVDAGSVLREVLHELGRTYKAALGVNVELGSAEAGDDRKKAAEDLESFVGDARRQLRI